MSVENKIKAGEVLDKSLEALGLSWDMQTDPKIILEVLKEMRLDDLQTSFLPMKDFLAEVVAEPKELGSIFQNIKLGMVNKHPAIVEFLELALEKEWLSGSSEHVNRSAHVTFVLEHITAAMCNNHGFFIDIHNHLRSKEYSYGLDSRNIIKTFLKIFTTTHHVFDTLKIISVDPSMLYFRISRGLGKFKLSKKELKNLYKNNELNFMEYRLLCPVNKKYGLDRILQLIEINIYEAGILEFENGFKTNSIAAFELNEDMLIRRPVSDFQITNITPEGITNKFYDSVSSIGNLFPVFSFSQEWVSLYTTWNMAFVLSNFDDWDILLPKLFIPSIINVKSENASGVRMISLWLSINTFFFRKYDGLKKIIGPNNKKEMAQAWGEINKKYAFHLAKRETHENSKTLKKHYRRMFSRPIYNLFKLFVAFLR